MCAIVGFIYARGHRDELLCQVNKMLSPVHHRGPDDGGVWVDEHQSIGFGHRRLSILDLSVAGHQPMSSACGRYVIVFNGEIYNHLDLRNDIEKSTHHPVDGWRGHSDTETLLACFSAWGVEKTLQSSIGMFALALWDKQKKILTLARDRIGEKPLYYGWQNGVFLFGSELRSLRAHPSFCAETDWNVASTFLHLNYIPAPSSIYKGVYKLEPGSFLQLSEYDAQQHILPLPMAYWSLGAAYKRGLENPFSGSFEDAVDETELLVRKAVQMQSVADVPVGAFLSGGIDSSTVVAMMKSATTSKVTTFSIGMSDDNLNESHHAAKVARYLGTNHVEYIIQPHDVLDLIPNLSEIWDEPFADSSQIPTYLVSKLASKEVKVVLSGDGGDEFFLGYTNYALYQKLWETKCLGKLPWNVAFAALSPFAKNHKVDSFLTKSKSVVNAWRQSDEQMLHRYWIDKYRQGVIPLAEDTGVKMLDLPIFADVATTASLWDAGKYLPDDILVKVDRASMKNSLEARAPLLDHRIVEFAFSLPLEYKLKSGVNKRVLREVLYRHVPQRIVNRPKMGFAIPLTDWLMNELRPWAESLLSQIPNDSEHFNKQMIEQMWREHLSGHKVHTDQLWGIFSLLGFLR